MDFRLNDDQRMLYDSVKRFANQVVRTAAPHLDLEAKMDANLFKAATELGLPLDALPAAHGGYLEGPFSHLSRALRDDQLGNACAGVAHQLESITDIALAIGSGNEKTQAKWFKHIAGQAYATGAILGTNDSFTATANSGGYLVSGSQSAVLLAESAHVWLIKATAAGKTVLLLLAGKSGGAETFTISSTGWRACDMADVNLADIKVDADDVLAEGAEADAIWETLLDGARLSVAARGVGVAQAAVDFAQQYANDRVQFQRPIAKFQAIAQMLEESKSAIAAARLLVQHTASRLDSGEKLSTDIRNVKAHVSRVLTRATIDAVQVLGGYGFVNDYPVEKYYRDARVFEAIYGRDILDVLIAIQAA